MVTHILKDGTVLQDISGHVVKMKDARQVYELIQSINKKQRRK